MKAKIVAIAVAWLLSFSWNAQSAEETVWRVGVFDGSSGEFADGDPHQAVNFVVGRDRIETSWFAYTPVAWPGKAAEPAAAPRSIAFPIVGRPEHAYRLRVSILIDRSSVPALRVAIDGRTGLFYLHPRLDYAMGDMVAAFYPAYSRAEVDVEFPGSWLKTGQNSISLQAVATGGTGVPDAGFNYDAVELDRIARLPPAANAAIEPTIFFSKHDSALDERVDVFVRYSQRPHSGRVQLSLAGHTYSHALRGDQDFGEERVSFDVPEFGADSRAEVRVDVNGHATHVQETLQPQKQWTLFLVPHVHLDVGYTDYQAKVAAIQSRILDEAMDLAEKHPGFRLAPTANGTWISS
jgi:hypothetical protein